MQKKFSTDKKLSLEAKGDINIEKFIKVESGAVFNDGGSVTLNNHFYGAEKETAPVAKSDLIQRLLPVFKGSEENVQRFLTAIRDAKPTKITAVVNEWVAQKLIDPRLRHKRLWEALNQNGLYCKSVANWNSQVM